MTTAIAIIVSLSVIAYLAYLLIKANRALSELDSKYGNICDTEKYAANLRDDAEVYTNNLKTEAAKSVEETLRQKIQLQDDMANLKTKYDSGRHHFEELSRHISTLEENSEMLDFGLYRPHFDFGTSEDYKLAAQKNYELQKELIKNDKAMNYPSDWTVNGSKTEGRKMTKLNMKVMLRAFNGECDSFISKVRWDNVLKMEERVVKSFEAINKSGEVTRISITRDYLKCKLSELRLAHELALKIKEEREEQRRIQEEMRAVTDRCNHGRQQILLEVSVIPGYSAHAQCP